MQLEFEGEQYTLDIDDIDIRQAIFIQERLGLTISQLWPGFKDGDPKAVIAMYWLMRNQSGTVVDIQKVNFKPVRFQLAVLEAMTAELEAQVNPTGEPQDEAQTTST